jgi:hypothetical protein
VGTSLLGRRDDSTGLLGTGSVGIVARSLRLSVVGFEECGLAGASTGELVVHADDDSFHGRRRPFEAGVGTFGRVLCVAVRRGPSGAGGGAYRGPGSPAPTVTLTARVWWARETAR